MQGDIWHSRKLNGFYHSTTTNAIHQASTYHWLRIQSKLQVNNCNRRETQSTHSSYLAHLCPCDTRLYIFFPSNEYKKNQHYQMIQKPEYTLELHILVETKKIYMKITDFLWVNDTAKLLEIVEVRTILWFDWAVSIKNHDFSPRNHKALEVTKL